MAAAMSRKQNGTLICVFAGRSLGSEKRFDLPWGTERAAGLAEPHGLLTGPRLPSYQDKKGLLEQ